MLITYLLFVAGFGLLIGGAHALVSGASSIGLKLKVPQMVMGLTVVALGTSLPELMVNIFASIQGNMNLAIGNVLGSNITNTLLVVGASALIVPIHMGRKTLTKDIPFSIFALLVLFMLANDWIFGRSNVIGRVDGIILILLLGYFVFSLMKKDGVVDPVNDALKTYSWLWSVVYIMMGSVGLYFGGKWIVDGALDIARVIGISETAMGLTLVSGATSLPELVTSIIASRKNNADMALGNALGSNVMNILLVLGVTAMIRPIPFVVHLNVEIGLVFLAALLLLVFAKMGRTKNTLNRTEGMLLVLLYFAFIYFSVIYQ